MRSSQHSARTQPWPTWAWLLAGCASEAPDPLLGRSYDQVAWATTHNAMSAGDDGWYVPSQQHDVPTQLAAGVRGLMLDVHEEEGEPWLCHSTCSLGAQPLVEGLAEIGVFMAGEPQAVVTIIFESYVSAEQMEQAFATSGLLEQAWEQQPGEPWPELQEMIDQGQRLVVLSDRDGGQRPWLLDIWAMAWETHWHAESPDELSCDPNRGDPSNALFVLNHFLTDPVSLPDLAEEVNHNPFFEQRALDCLESSGSLPNFLAVDFYDIGDVLEVARTLNER